MSRSPGATCLVDDCGRAATDGVPLDEDNELDLGVCAHHAGEINADRSRWQIRTIPLTAQRSRTIIERIPDPEPTT